MRLPRIFLIPAGLGGPFETKARTQGYANHSWSIGSEQSGKHPKCGQDLPERQAGAVEGWIAGEFWKRNGILH